MKKKILSILATLLLCLALQSVTALAVDDPEGSSFGVTVNETQVTVSNQNDVLGNGWVSYDPDTNVLSVNGSQGSNLTISGSGSTDVVINGSLTSNSPVVGKLTIDGANNVTLTASCSSPAISSDANITFSGDVNISNSSGFCVGGPLTVNGANDVTVTASYSNGPAINSTANITCTGDVTISNETGFCTDSSLTVESAKDVTVTAKTTVRPSEVWRISPAQAM